MDLFKISKEKILVIQQYNTKGMIYNVVISFITHLIDLLKKLQIIDATKSKIYHIGKRVQLDAFLLKNFYFYKVKHDGLYGQSNIKNFYIQDNDQNLYIRFIDTREATIKKDAINTTLEITRR
jgi:hypothetical protein